MTTSLAHVGVLGMRRGRRKSAAPDSKPVAKKNNITRNVLIGVGVGVTVAAAGVLYLKNKKTIDGAVSSFLQKSKNKKVKELPKLNPKINDFVRSKGSSFRDPFVNPYVNNPNSPKRKDFSGAEKAIFNKYGIKVKGIDVGNRQILGVKNGKITGPIDIGNRQVFRPQRV